ncbi:uncharacterized protein LOC134777975 [Penaeus indicus]|uniref:uncharacterized protein LOC134777975 n=1 Tax=Penaeus indicus TaxID=29960 RepID=UPI00300CD925
MRSLSAGVGVLDAHKGYLELTEEALEQLIRREPIAEHYEVEHTPFARGKFAAVRRARCLASGTWFAAKFMRKRRRAQDVRHEILHEAAVLLLTRPCARIVSLHQLFESASEVILVLELASGGELQRVIDEEERLEEEVVRRYMLNILSALRYLHAHNIAHLDLKPQNLLLTGQHPDSDVKLCDFGISRILLSDIEVREVLGTPDYVAPEILQYEPISLATDMWSVGVLTYVLLTGHSPFGGDTKQETFLNISQGHVDFPEDLFEGVSQQGKDFISHLLVVDPSGRLTVDEALEHQWLRTAPTPAQPPPLVPAASAPARPEGHATREQAAPRPRTPPTDARCASPRASASPRARRHGEAAAVGATGLSLGVRRDSSPRPSSPARSSDHRVKLHVSNFNLKAASTADLSTKAKSFPAPSRLCRERAEGPAAAATPSPRLTKEPETSGPFGSSREAVAPPASLGREPASVGLSREPAPSSLALSRDPAPASLAPNREAVTTSLSLNREADGTWRTADSVNKENNQNSINKEEAPHISSPCRDALDSPSRSRGRFVHAEIAKAGREAEARRLAGGGKEGKENKENGREGKDGHRERLRPSPLCLRRQGSKGDLHSPTEQQKFGPMQGCVTKRIEKGMIY